MAGSIFTSFGAGDANATAFMTHLTAMTKGYNALSLTNMDNTTVPAIAAGSLIENNGALFKFDTEDTISTTDPHTSTTVADGTVYIMLVPSGSSISACFTATAPTWSDSKQGWYGVGGYVNNRYLSTKIAKSSSSFIKKIPIIGDNLQNCITRNTNYIEPVKITGGISLFTDVYIATGTLGTTQTSISYPSGYTQSNSIILSVMVLDSTGNYGTPGPAGASYVVYGVLSPTNIIIVTGAEYNGRQYKLVVAKIG